MNAKAFTLVEVISAMAIALLLGILTLGAHQSVFETAMQAECTANLRQWGVALLLYAQDHDGRIPRRGQGVRPVEILDRPADWFNALPPYLGELSYSELSQRGVAPKAGVKSLFVCRLAKDMKKPHFLSYGMNMYLSPWIRPDPHRIQEIPDPSRLAFLADGPGGWSSTVPSSQEYSVLARHDGRANVVFLDGHVGSFRGEILGCGVGNRSLPEIRWETETSGVNQTRIP